MATFLLLHGAGSDGWYWHRVAPHLAEAGHEVVAPDLPVGDESAGLADYAAVATGAVDGRDDVMVVGQSLSGFVAPLVAAARPVSHLVLVAAMTPAPGESAGDWWANTAQAEAARHAAVADGRDPDAPFDPIDIFLHDVPDDLVAASVNHVRPQADRFFADPFPLDAWPATPMTFILGRRDRFFPADFQRRVVQTRLGITPIEIDSGHLPALSRPAELAGLLLACHRGGDLRPT